MRTRTIILVALMTLFAASLAMAKPDTMVREEIPDKYKWDLTDIFESWEAWEQAKAELATRIENFREYEGTLNKGADHLAKVLAERDDVSRLADKVYVYAFLNSVQDTRSNEAQARFKEANGMMSTLTQATSWFKPELINVGRKTVLGWVDENEALADYAFPLSELFRLQEHVLNAEQEKLLSLAEPFKLTPSDTYIMLSTADADFPVVTLSDGEEVQATMGNYMRVLYTNPNQDDRMKTFKAFYSIYDKFPNTYAGIANGIFQRNWFEAQARKYNSVLEMSLDDNTIPVDVYTTLIETAKKGSAPLRRYHELRKQVMGLDEYYYFDAYFPLAEADATVEYEKAMEIILESVKPLGEEYTENVKRAFEDRWIDVYENTGKESGAFSQGLYDVHPYVKLNHADTMNDMFTIAHELGHALHSVYASSTQPYATAGYATFVAEVASTMGEHLLMEEMLARTDDPQMRIALLEQAIGSIAATFYRQAMFADYEYKAHTMVEEGKPVTSESLAKLYVQSQQDIFGESLDGHDLYRNTWAYVSHFFFEQPYYVYQYATSLSASTKLFQDMTSGSEKQRAEARQRYATLISAGGSKPPVQLLMDAGVDMTDPATYQAMTARMDELVTRLEKELKKQGMID